MLGLEIIIMVCGGSLLASALIFIQTPQNASSSQLVSQTI